MTAGLVFDAIVLEILGAAAVTDLRSRRIPNALSALLLVTFAGAILVLPEVRGALGSHLAAGGVAFAAGFALFMLRMFGGGDAKLFAALSLFYTLGGLGQLAVATALAGGVIGAGFLLARVRRTAPMPGAEGKPNAAKVPYAVAILIGFVVTRIV